MWIRVRHTHSTCMQLLHTPSKASPISWNLGFGRRVRNLLLLSTQPPELTFPEPLFHVPSVSQSHQIRKLSSHNEMRTQSPPVLSGINARGHFGEVVEKPPSWIWCSLFAKGEIALARYFSWYCVLIVEHWDHSLPNSQNYAKGWVGKQHIDLQKPMCSHPVHSRVANSHFSPALLLNLSNCGCHVLVDLWYCLAPSPNATDTCVLMQFLREGNSH